MTDQSIPAGLCQCGCGEPTTIYNGRARIFVWGHNLRLPRKPWILREGIDYERQERGYDSPCFVWLHGKSRKGYGLRSRMGDRSTGVHRTAYEQTFGEIPPDLTIDHLCSQKDCVNPLHMEVVTRGENVRRSKKPLISVSQARELRRLRANGMALRPLAARFGISTDTIGRVVRGEFPYDHDEPRRGA